MLSGQTNMRLDVRARVKLDECVTDTGLSRPKFISLLILVGADELTQGIKELKLTKSKMKQLTRNLVTEEQQEVKE